MIDRILLFFIGAVMIVCGAVLCFLGFVMLKTFDGEFFWVGGTFFAIIGLSAICFGISEWRFTF